MYKKISKKIEIKLKKILNKYPLVQKIVSEINGSGGKALLVGGAVRDLLLNLEVKDLDIEIHGLRQKKLEQILKSFGSISLVGKSFGVFRLHGLDIDWSLPRKDSKGRKPTVKIDPFMSIKEAFRRRDLTINSMAIDLNSFELVDPFNGAKDLKNKILRATDKKLFIEDPLRFYRVMQFIGRFDMYPDKQLNKICQQMDIKHISRERIEEEFKKLFLKSKKPSIGIEWLHQIKRLKEILPELYDTIGIPQNPKWHPEGDVYEHTKQALDAAATFKYNSNDEKLILMWSALCHDLGKAATTKFVDGRFISHEHEVVGEKLAKKLLKRITNNINLIETVCKLVRWHMQPGQLVENAKPSAYKRLALKLYPNTNLQMLSKLFLADRLGRNPKKGKPLKKKMPECERFEKEINELDLSTSIEKPIIQGKDLLDKIQPGPLLGKLVKFAYEIQIEEGIKNKTELKKRVLESLR